MIYEHCANCGCYLPDGVTTGESGLYSPNRAFTLCEPCWLSEERLTDESGTNDHPDLLAHYVRTLEEIDE